MVLLILVVIWAVVLIPPWLQSRRESRPGDSIATFRQQLNVLERTAPGQHIPGQYGVGATVVGFAARRPSTRPGPARTRVEPLRRSDVRRRRREVFLTLLGAVGLTFVSALLVGGPVWALHLATVMLLAGYVGMLVRLQQQAAERRAKVRYMPRAQGIRPAEGTLLLHRSGS